MKLQYLCHMPTMLVLMGFIATCAAAGPARGDVLRSVRAEVAQHGGVILELHLADEAPWVALRPQNVAQLHGPARPTADARRMTS